MIRKVKHLYVHIPFCNSICTYCDFVRYVRNDQTKEEYVNKIIEQIKHQYKNHKFSTIYIGGGTPNCLNDDLLNKLLCTLSHYLLNKYEFTIECNPELITDTQIRTLKQNKVNRVSIGVQSINDSLLRKIHRKHTLIDVKKAIDKLRKFKINNISIDLIYGFNEQTLSNIKDTCTFIKKHKIPHVSWYSLEVSNNSIMNKQGYKTNIDNIGNQFKLIIDTMNNINYKRYEVSNWSINRKYESIHNKCYWLSKEWAGLGIGAYGFENKKYYHYVGKVTKYKKISELIKTKDFYFQILMMGLRLVEGIDVTIQPYKSAYKYFKNKLVDVKIIHKKLLSKNINLLNNTLEKIL